jgi:NAD(P)H dehydrogenase (quinone)
MTIAITGATGHLGRLAIAALKTRVPAGEIIALARDPAKAADLGVAVRLADYQRPETLGPALQGVQTLVLISSNDFSDRVADHARVVAAAKSAGVGRIIYTSILKGEASPLNLAADHIATEAAIKASGLSWTLLRNGWYTENATGSLGGALAAGAMIGSAGEGRFSYAARADYAEAIAAVAAGTGHEGKAYELGGDTAVTMADVAAEVSRQTGKTIPYNSLPEATYVGILQSFGLPAGFAAILADSDVKAASGALYDDSKTLSALIGRPTTPVAETVKAALAAL